MTVRSDDAPRRRLLLRAVGTWLLAIATLLGVAVFVAIVILAALLARVLALGLAALRS